MRYRNLTGIYVSELKTDITTLYYLLMKVKKVNLVRTKLVKDFFFVFPLMLSQGAELWCMH
jgi:hypothetical protein